MPRGILEQVQKEFNRWKSEQGPRACNAAPLLLTTPFTDEVMDHHYVINLRVLGNKGYNDKTDQEEHINSDAIICHAAEWFKTLESKSIDNFAELAKRVIQRFATSKVV